MQDWGQPISSCTLLAHVAPRPNPVFNSDFALLEQVLEDLLSNNPSLRERYKYQVLAAQIKFQWVLTIVRSHIHEATPYTRAMEKLQESMEAWSAGLT